MSTWAKYNNVSSLLLVIFPLIPCAFAEGLCGHLMSGELVCWDKLSPYSGIAIAIATTLGIFLVIGIVIYLKRNRTLLPAENMDDSQVRGPPTVLATSYDPSSGTTSIYSGQDGSSRQYYSTMQMPVPNIRDGVQSQTAPVTRVTFSDQPYPNDSELRSNAQPRTAVGNGDTYRNRPGSQWLERLRSRH